MLDTPYPSLRRLRVYERAGILLVEVYERVGKSVIWVCERAQRAEQVNFMGIKPKKRSILAIDSYLNDSAFQSSQERLRVNIN